MMNTQKRKFKIYLDEAKNRQTTHWDWDCMTTEEIQSAYREADRQRSKSATRPMAAYVNRCIESVASLFRKAGLSHHSG